LFEHSRSNRLDLEADKIRSTVRAAESPIRQRLFATVAKMW
jgi:hypothetical protein